LRLLCPDRFVESVLCIDPVKLSANGFRAALLDVDNTLVGWQRADLRSAVAEWVGSLKEAGLKVCIVSNTRSDGRLEQLAERLGVPFVRRPWKPRRRGFLQAMSLLGVNPGETVMIGDQMFTDVLGGNRAGLTTIMVRPLARREFAGTKISRAVERVLLSWFRRRRLLGGEQAPREGRRKD
jgi:HAD superfamily phosphatase (TIGR01668 family)